MEIYLMYAVGMASVAFIAVAVYLHLLRKKAENIFPTPFLNPAGRKKAAGKRKA